MRDLNMWLQEPRDAQEEEFTTVLAACGLEYMTAHFMPRRRYIGDGLWKWRTIKEDRQVTGWEYYIL